MCNSFTVFSSTLKENEWNILLTIRAMQLIKEILLYLLVIFHFFPTDQKLYTIFYKY